MLYLLHTKNLCAISNLHLAKRPLLSDMLKEVSKKEENSGIIYILSTTKSTATFKGAPPLSGAVRDWWYESNIFRADNKEKEGSLGPLQGTELVESFKYLTPGCKRDLFLGISNPGWGLATGGCHTHLLIPSPFQGWQCGRCRLCTAVLIHS